MLKLIVILFLMNSLQKANSQSIVTCSCDLTSSACDGNCCCDPDCTTEDISAFVCSNATYNEDSQLCVNQLVFVNNLPTTTVVNNNGLFCIIRERDTSNNFYTEPTILNDTAEFNAASQQYPTYSYDLSTTATTYSQVYYVAGDQIDVQYSNELRGKLSFAIPGIANTCVDTNPAAYLSDQTSTCNRRFTLSNSCSSGSVLDSASYYSPTFTIAKVPITNITDSTSFVNVLICDGSTTPGNITYNAGTGLCSNVAASVSYRITYDGTNGISSACVSFPQVSDISQSSISQTFSISFVSSATVLNETESRSGNPGYVIGRSLRTASGGGLGNLTIDATQFTLISPNSNGDGTCTGVASQQINFGEDARTGCLLSYTRSTACNSLQESIISVLNIPSNAYLATYGNTLITSNTTNDWLQPPAVALPANRSDTPETACPDMWTGLNYTIYFANTGSISNPQPQIIGIEYVPVTKSIAYECFGVDCITGTVSQFVEITSTVTFVDASSTPSSILRERPTVNARLPSDFFFPFTGTAT
ncbi:tectonic-3-like [Styela clava]